MDNAAVPDVAAQLINELQTGLNQINPTWIEGIYLTGSITLGDFYMQKSDLDFLVLYRQFPSQDILNQLTELHDRIQRRYPKPVLNGVYLTRQNLLARNLATNQILLFQEGKLSKGLFDMGPITLYELKTTAYVVTGTPISRLPVDIDLAYIKRFMHTNINSYWQKWLNRHSSLAYRKGLLILFPGLTEWAVLGITRQFYTLKHGKIVSKREAGVYCLEEVPASYRPIIEEAIQIRMSMPSWANGSVNNIYSIRPSWRRANQTLACMQYLIDQFNALYPVQK